MQLNLVSELLAGLYRFDWWDSIMTAELLLSKLTSFSITIIFINQLKRCKHLFAFFYEYFSFAFKQYIYRQCRIDHKSSVSFSRLYSQEDIFKI